MKIQTTKGALASFNGRPPHEQPEHRFGIMPKFVGPWKPSKVVNTDIGILRNDERNEILVLRRLGKALEAFGQMLLVSLMSTG